MESGRLELGIVSCGITVPGTYPEFRGRLGEAEAEAGMSQKSEKFREKGGEIYLPTK